MLNRVTLIGRVGHTPDFKISKSGEPCCHISIATNEFFRDKSGEMQTETQWHRIVCFGAIATFSQNLPKGSLILVEGKLQYYRHQQSDSVVIASVLASSIKIVEKRQQA